MDTGCLGLGRSARRREGEDRHRRHPHCGDLQPLSPGGSLHSPDFSYTPKPGVRSGRLLALALAVVTASSLHSLSCLSPSYFPYPLFFPLLPLLVHFSLLAPPSCSPFPNPSGGTQVIFFTNGTYPPPPSPNQAVNPCCSVGCTSACY